MGIDTLGSFFTSSAQDDNFWNLQIAWLHARSLLKGMYSTKEVKANNISTFVSPESMSIPINHISKRTPAGVTSNRRKNDQIQITPPPPIVAQSIILAFVIVSYMM